MSARTKARVTAEWAEIRVSVPAPQAVMAKKAIAGVFGLAGVRARFSGKNPSSGHEWIPAADVFPDSSPGRLLRGLRTREDLTQAQLAEALGIHPHHVSDMERGIRNISPAMARKIERLYQVPRHFFL
jgi:DNA-binding transcriptional regulator YdaS (Cro superfamily)